MAQVSAELEDDEKVILSSRLQRYRGDVLLVIVLHTAVVVDEIQHNGFISTGLWNYAFVWRFFRAATDRWRGAKEREETSSVRGGDAEFRVINSTKIGRKYGCLKGDIGSKIL